MTESFDLDARIWRYMAFDKFVDLLLTEELYLARAEQFRDSWEMYPPAGFLNAENWRPLIANNPFALEVDLDALIENTMAAFEAAYYSRGEYTFSCWSRAEREHAGLWDLFTDQQNAVAITSTPRKLITSARCTHMQGQMLAVGGVSYVDFEADDLPVTTEQVYRGEPLGYWREYPEDEDHSAHRFEPKSVPINQARVLPYFYKRDSYAYEQEVRLVSYTPKFFEQPLLQRLPVYLADLIDGIVLAPRSNRSFCESVESIAAEKLPGIPVRRSRLHFDRSQSERCRRFLEAQSFAAKVMKERDAPGSPFYILFENVAEFTVWIDRVNHLMGIPAFEYRLNSGGLAYEGSGSARWALPDTHPDSADPRVVAIATESIRLDRQLLTRAECQALGFFPPPPPLPWSSHPDATST